MQNVCIQNVACFTKLLYKFCMQNLAGIVLLILYTKCIQMFVKIWYAFCINCEYILYASVVYILYNFCIQKVSTVFVWVAKIRLLFLWKCQVRLNLPVAAFFTLLPRSSED